MKLNEVLCFNDDDGNFDTNVAMMIMMIRIRVTRLMGGDDFDNDDEKFII